ncbi:MAG: carboxypeptidase regulatory-like domain-containing protein [Bacteroidales bacterium]|nr:carboxypeptidase regulatory-like domain-containing protein [Bacteroidales bacterium]
MKYWVNILLALAMPLTEALAQDMLHVAGTVVNGADGNVLPLCHVQLLQGKTSVAEAYSDYAGNYNMKNVPPGSYTFLVTQFGDTLMCYYGLHLERDTWVRSVVLPPSDEKLSNMPYYDAGMFRYLRPILIVAQKNMLHNMGLLITSPHDPRLWDFNGRFDGDHSASRDLSGSKIHFGLLVHPGFEVHPLGSAMKNDLILYGRIRDVLIPAPTVPWEIIAPDTVGNSGD